MKLIRLFTDSDDGVFNNTINSDELIISPNSQIALQSLSLEQTDAVLIVNAQNNTITYTLDNRNTVEQEPYVHEIEFEEGTYSSVNYNDMLTSIEDKLNIDAIYDSGLLDRASKKVIGIEWKATDNDNKINIGYKSIKQNLYPEMWKATSTVTSNSQNIYECSVDTDGFGNGLSLQTYLSKGNSRACARVYKMIYDGTRAGEEQGFLIGLSREKIDPEYIGTANLQYGIGMELEDQGGGLTKALYYTYVNGIRTNSSEYIETGVNLGYEGLSNANNDLLSVEVNGDLVQMGYYRNLDPFNPYLQVVGSTIRTEVIPLYPFIIFYSKSDFLRINYLRAIPSPYTNVSVITEGIEDDVGLGTPAQSMPINPKIPTNNVMEFNSSDVSDWLGFDTPRIPEIGYYNVAQYTYTATNNLDVRVLVDSITIESLTLKLLSFDAVAEQQKSILAYCPVSNIDSMVNYIAPYLAFIDIRNQQTITLRNLKFRLMDGENNPLRLNGKAYLVILVQEK